MATAKLSAVPQTNARLKEQEGAGALAKTRREGDPPRSSPSEVTALQNAVGVRMPAGYSTFVTKVGEGIYGNLVRIYPPGRVESELEPWRERVGRHWFWGKRPLSREEAQEAVRIGDTLAGDELVVHPRDPDAVLLLPRESERARVLARGLAPALAKLVKSKDPTLRPLAPTAAPSRPAVRPAQGGSGARRPALPPGTTARGGAEASPATKRAVTTAVAQLAYDKVRELLEANPGVLTSDADDAAWSAELLVASINGLQSKARLHEVRTPAKVRDALVAEHRRTFDLLLAHGADPNGDPAQVSPLRQAVLVSCPPIVAALVARGADPTLAHPAFGTVLELAQELVDEGGGAAEEQILATLRAASPPT